MVRSEKAPPRPTGVWGEGPSHFSLLTSHFSLKKNPGAEAPRVGVAGRRRRQTPRTATIYFNERQALGMTPLGK